MIKLWHMTHEGDTVRPGLNVGWMYDSRRYWWFRMIYRAHLTSYYLRLRWMPGLSKKTLGFGNSEAKLVLIIKKTDHRLDMI